jgi:hypothetical protein
MSKRSVPMSLAIGGQGCCTVSDFSPCSRNATKSFATQSGYSGRGQSGPPSPLSTRSGHFGYASHHSSRCQGNTSAARSLTEEIFTAGSILSGGSRCSILSNSPPIAGLRSLPRLPDGSGKVEAAGAQALCVGDAEPLGHNIIHSVTNPIPRLTGAIHVYGGDFFAAERSEWDPESLQEGRYDMAKNMKLFEDANALTKHYAEKRN